MYSIGIDLGGSRIKFVCIDAEGVVLDRESPELRSVNAIAIIEAFGETRSRLVDGVEALLELALRPGEEFEDEDIPDDAPIGPDVLRVHLTPYMAQQFARRANSVVAGGVPTCPYCGAVLEPPGHFCTRRFDDLVH